MSNSSHPTEGRLSQVLLIGGALAFLGLFLLLPLIAVFSEALRQGAGLFFAAVQNPDAVAAIQLTLLVAAISVPLSTTRLQLSYKAASHLLHVSQMRSAQ